MVTTINQTIKTLNSNFFTLLAPIPLVLVIACGSSEESNQFEPIFDSNFSCQTTVGELPDSSLNWFDLPERFNSEADILAMEATQSFTSSDELYERTVSDLVRIRAEFDTAGSASPCISFSKMIVWFDEETMQSVISGNYDGWLALNEQYGVDGIALPFSNLPFAEIYFRRQYYMPSLIHIYQETNLPGVESIEGVGAAIGISGDLCLENASDLSRYYIFYNGSGDCPSGCIINNYSGYKINADDSIQHLGDYTTSATSDEPEWFSSRQQCRVFL